MASATQSLYFSLAITFCGLTIKEMNIEENLLDML
jgi:hypothetical protein